MYNVATYSRGDSTERGTSQLVFQTVSLIELIHARDSPDEKQLINLI